jgi:2-methylisocitrate lyase-like PEP mutase family enzyme
MRDAGDPRPLDGKAAVLRALHHADTILTLPNAWDVGSAVIFAQAGFPAVATTSSGIELSVGLPCELSARRDAMLSAVARIARAVHVPLTADMESGYGARPDDVAETIRRVIDAGAVGVNLEDVIDGLEVAMREGRKTAQWPIEEAVERISAARRAADEAGVRIVINARTDAFIVDQPREAAIDDAIRRGNAYLAVGADCVFVPFVTDADTIATLARAIKGPLNILGGPQTPTVGELQALGVARVSIGGSLSRAVMHAVRAAARELKEEGTFGYAEHALSYEDTIGLLGA